MFNCAIPIFLLMLGTAFLAGLFAWLWARRELEENTEEIPQLRNELVQVKEEVDRLLEYTNGFHMEKRILTEENENLTLEVFDLKAHLQQMTKDRGFLMSEFNRVNLQLEASNNLEEIFFDGKKVEEEAIAEPATDNAELNQQVLEKQLQGIQDELVEWRTKYEAIKDSLSKKERKVLGFEKLSENGVKTKKWETKYKKLKLKMLAVTKERDTSQAQLETLKLANDKLLTELLNANARIELPKPKKEKDEVFVRINRRKELFDFKKIGEFTSKQKDDLKKISGVGPFIEKKLNALGIYKFEQLANLTDDDVHQIIKIIEVPSGIIKGANWIEQAKNMK